MRIILKFILSILVLVLFTSYVHAQDYESAIGARLGSPLSVSYKTFINAESAVELYVGFRGYATYNWVSINGAYQKHNPIVELDGLSWYYGAGAGVYFWNYDLPRDFASTTFGLHGYLGLDYKFDSTPLNLSIDWIPSLFIGNSFFKGFGGGYGSLGVRYVFKE